MRSRDVAPTITTRCVTPACGRFVHPKEDRAITLREAAALQTFPLDYRFEGGRIAIAAQIGNAVPVGLAQAIGRLYLASMP
jgi:DNA (cytosine-5)-methyltransferase 1